MGLNVFHLNENTKAIGIYSICHVAIEKATICYFGRVLKENDEWVNSVQDRKASCVSTDANLKRRLLENEL